MVYILAKRVPKQDNSTQIFTLFAGAALFGYFVQNLFLFDTPGTAPSVYMLVGFMVFVDSAYVTCDSKVNGTYSRFWSLLVRRPYLTSKSTLLTGVSCASLLILLTVFFLNYRALDASQTYLETVNQTRSWGQRLESFQRTVNLFPQLANYPRAAMFTQLDRNWHNLTPDEASQALAIATNEGMIGIDAEPEEWRIYLTLASVYQAATATHSGTVASARELIEKATVLAPNRMEIIQMQAFQNMIEGDPPAALEVLDTYVNENPGASRFFKELRAQIVKASDN